MGGRGTTWTGPCVGRVALSGSRLLNDSQAQFNITPAERKSCGAKTGRGFLESEMKLPKQQPQPAPPRPPLADPTSSALRLKVPQGPPSRSSSNHTLHSPSLFPGCAGGSGGLKFLILSCPNGFQNIFRSRQKLSPRPQLRPHVAQALLGVK